MSARHYVFNPETQLIKPLNSPIELEIPVRDINRKNKLIAIYVNGCVAIHSFKIVDIQPQEKLVLDVSEALLSYTED